MVFCILFCVIIISSPIRKHIQYEEPQHFYWVSQSKTLISYLSASHCLRARQERRGGEKHKNTVRIVVLRLLLCRRNIQLAKEGKPVLVVVKRFL